MVKITTNEKQELAMLMRTHDRDEKGEFDAFLLDQAKLLETKLRSARDEVEVRWIQGGLQVLCSLAETMRMARKRLKEIQGAQRPREGSGHSWT